MIIMSWSWFVAALYLVDRLAADAKVLVRQFLDCDCEELRGYRGYFGGCSCVPFNKLLFCSVVSRPLSIDI